MGSSVREHRRAIAAAVIGTVLVCAYAIFALVQILWLNPHAAVPGVNLEQIWQDMSAADESMSAPLVIGVMSVGPIVAVLVLVMAVVRAATKPLAMVIFYLSILVLGPIAYFVASFGPGMALADTYGITGYDHSTWARLLYVVSGVALLTLIAITAVSRRANHTNHSVPA